MSEPLPQPATPISAAFRVPPPPVTHRDARTDTFHGVEVADPYRWLELDDASNAAWTDAQDTRTRTVLAALPDHDWFTATAQALQSRSYVAGVRVGGDQCFTMERPAGYEQEVLVVRNAMNPGGPGRVLLDPSSFADDAATAIDWFHPSPDGTLVAYGISDGGDERSVLHVLDVTTGSTLEDRIPDTWNVSLAWLPDSRSFIYRRCAPGTTIDPKIYLHLVGTDAAGDPVLWDRHVDDQDGLFVKTSPCGRWLAVTQSHGWSAQDIWLVDLDDPSRSPLVVQHGLLALTRLCFTNAGLVAVTTLDAPNGRIVAIDPEHPGVDQWVEIVAEPDSPITGIVANDTGFIYHGHDWATYLGAHTHDEQHLPIPAGVTITDIEATPARPEVWCCFERFTSPAVALQRWVPGGSSFDTFVVFDDAEPLDRYTTSMTTARSADGTAVDIMLVHRSDVTPGPEVPLVLYGYGGFSVSMTPAWSTGMTAWAQRGGVYAVAVLRGGGEHGELWHQAGMLDRKQRVFDDFAAAIDHLVAGGYASRARLGIRGGSNGGLLVAATVTQRPDICAAAVSEVPLTDMIRFPELLIGRLWVPEYGDPTIEEQFTWLHAYSPYHHVEAGVGYPAVLLTTAEGEGRVHPSHAKKMAAALQHATSTPDSRPVFLRVDRRAGHGAGKPVSMVVAESADIATFLAWQLGGFPA